MDYLPFYEKNKKTKKTGSFGPGSWHKVKRPGNWLEK